MDDDAPPPLASCPGQVQAVLSSTRALHRGDSGELPTAATMIDTATAPKKTGSIKRGFFDAKPSKLQAPKGGTAAQKPSSGVKRGELASIKANRSSLPPGSKAIPGCMMLEPSEQQKQYEAYKAQMLDKLRPTEDMVSKITSNPLLAEGFDDPEVMAAVNDVAANPAHIKKYKDNKKVQRFYEAMGQLVGQRLEEMGDGSTAGSSDGGSPSSKSGSGTIRPEPKQAAEPAAQQAKVAKQQAPAPASSAQAAAAALLTGQRSTQHADIKPLITRCRIEEVD